jgi:hypothetical protein
MLIRIITLAFLLCLISYNPSLHSGLSGDDVAVVVPREAVLQLIAHQPNCPLKIEHTELHAYIRGGNYPDLKLRHMGNKPIRSFKVAYLDTKGTGGSWISAKRAISPGQIITVSEEPASTKFVPLSEELSKKLNLDGRMKGMIIFMITRVDYTDGTFYEDERIYNNLNEFLEKYSKCSPHM